MRQRTLGAGLQVSAAVPRMITVVQSENSLWWRRPEALVAGPADELGRLPVPPTRHPDQVWSRLRPGQARQRRAGAGRQS